MKKHTSEEAYYQRLQELAQSNKKNVDKSKSNSLGTLVDYKKAVDGINYGIVKENHKYYIKNGGIKAKPNVSDFTYIGGLGNVTDYQYKTLAEAKKNRNMIFETISENTSFKFEKTGKKKILNEDVNEDMTEDKAEDEIDAADSKIADLEATTEKAKEEPEMETGLEDVMDINLDDEEESGMELGDDEDGGMELGDDEEGLMKEIEKSLGKLTNKIRNIEMTESQVKYSINTFLAAFKDKLPEIEIEDRKEMANKILKVVDADEIESIGDEVESGEEGVVSDEMGAEEEEVSDEEEMNEVDICNECGDFARYAESKGYTRESINECGVEEMTNLVSGYANAHNDGMNDGDLESVALFVTPEITDTLTKDYGHDEYTEKLAPFVESLNETTDEDKQMKIDELWSGLSHLGKKAGQAVSGAAQKVGKKVGDVATGIKQTYYAGEKNAALEKAKKIANDLGQQIATVNKKAVKAGEEPINIGSILQVFTNQLKKGSSADASRFRTTEGAETEEEIVDEAITMVDALKNINKLSPEEREVFNGLNSEITAGNASPEVIDKIIELLSGAGKEMNVNRLGNLSEISEENVNEGEALLDIFSKVKHLSPEDKKEYEILYDRIMSTVLSDEELNTSDMDRMSDLLSGVGEEGEINEESRALLSDLLGKVKSLEPEDKKEYDRIYKKLVDQGDLSDEDKAVFSNFDNDIDETQLEEGKEKPSAGLSKKKKSEIVKKAKAGKDIGKTGKNFKKIEKAAEKSGADDPTAVAAAAMWKSIKRESKGESDSELITETEKKIRKYIRNRIQEKQGLKKASLNENKKSDAIKKLDNVIDKELKNFKSKSKKS